MSNNKFEQLLFNINSGNNNKMEMQTGQLLMAYGDQIDLLKCDQSGLSFIHYICKNGFHKLLKLLLLYYQTNVNNDISTLINLPADATYNRTPLMYAAMNGNLECVRVLLKYKELDVNIKDTDGENALFLTFNHLFNNNEIKSLNNTDMHKVLPLICNDVRYNQRERDPFEKTALMCAIAVQCDELVESIISQLQMLII